MNHKQEKLEAPERIKELNPAATLMRIGLKENDVLCDIGAGTGVFTVPAARITKNKVYGLDNDKDMLRIIKQKAETECLKNVELIKVEDEHFSLPDYIADIVLMVTVLHEIENSQEFLAEAKRILKNGGKIAVIEFHKWQTPKGPPPGHRISKKEIISRLYNAGFAVWEDFDLGENYNCLIFKLNSPA